MQMYHFLAALPAVLALSGFVAFQLLRRSGSGDDITRRIVEKLRREAPNSIAQDGRLSADQVERVLRGDQNLQRLIGKQDFLLLKQALQQQFIASLVVYSFVVLLCGFSIYLFLRHEAAKKQLVLSDISLSDPVDLAKGTLVDLDPLEVKWSASGEPEDLKIYLENIQSSTRTSALKGSSTENVVRFSTADYKNILINRNKGTVNRIRAVIQGKEGTFTSDPVDLTVGFTVLTVVDDDAKLTVAAMIDNSRIPFYSFQAKIVVPNRIGNREPLSIGPDIPYQFRSVSVSRPKELDWDNARGVYFSPDDPRLVRFDWLVADTVRQ